MNSINWDNFKLTHGVASREAFQLMSQFFLNATTGTRSTAFSPRYPGLEAAPVKGRDGRRYGFQSKYFDKGTSGSTKKREIIDSLKKVNDDIDCLYLFCNELDQAHWPNIESSFSVHRKKLKLSTVEVVWVVDIEGFQAWLLESRNANLLQIFFSLGRPIQLLNEQASRVLPSDRFIVNTNIQAIDGKYVSSDKLIEDIRSTLLKNKIFVLQGSPGSGKTVLFHQLYEKLAFKDLVEDYQKRLRAIAKNGLPIFIRARELSSRGLFDSIRETLSTYGLSLGQMKVYILVDGLDELDGNSAKRFVEDLIKINSPSYGINGVLISVRAANKNKYLLDSIEPFAVLIAQLTDEQIREYFVQKGHKDKLSRFDMLWKKASQEDKSLIRDIHLVVKLYDIIEKIASLNKATILEQAYLYSTLETDKLNLLNPQGFSLRLIHEEVSEDLFYRQGVGLTLSDLQGIIIKIFDRLGYSDVNDIVHSLGDGIFEDIPSHPNPDTIINYAHRSWVDFFAASKMAKDFALDKNFLAGISQYEDFLKKMFLPVARGYYWSKRDVPKLLSLGVIDYYLQAESDHIGDSSPADARIAVSQFVPQVREQVALEGFDLVNNGFISPALALKYYNSGYEDVAAGILNNAIEKLQEDDEDAIDEISRSAASFVALRFLIQKIDAKKYFIRWQNSVLKNDNLDKKHRFGPDPYAAIIGSLIDFGKLDVKWILENIDPRLFYVATRPFMKTSNLKILRKLLSNNPALSRKLFPPSLDQIEIVGLMGVAVDRWSKNTKVFAEKFLKELNERNSPYLDGYEYAVIRYGLLRILGYETEINGNEDYLVTGLVDVFGVLYRLMTIESPKQELINSTLRWIDVAMGHSFYDNRSWSNTAQYANTELVAEIVTRDDVEENFKDLLFKLSQEEGNEIVRIQVLPLKIFALDPKTLSKYYTYDRIVELYQKTKMGVEIGDNINAALNFAPLFAMYDESESLRLIQLGQNLPILRYGYHKDIYGYSVLEGLKSIWKMRINSVAKRRDYSEQVYECIMKIQDITDHSETGGLPDRFFEMLVNYDLAFSEEIAKRYLEDNYDDNPVRSIIIGAKIEAGHDFVSIKKLIDKYHRHHYGGDMIDSYYFEQRFIAYIQIANSNRYSITERTESLELAAKQIIPLKTDKHYHRGQSVSNYVDTYYKLRKELGQRQLSNFPRKSKYQNSSNFDASSYRSKEKSSIAHLNKIKKLSAEEFGSFLKTSQYGNVFSMHKIVRNTELVAALVSRAEDVNAPYDVFKETVERALTPWSFGEGSVAFLRAIYSSPIYREDFLNNMSHIPQQYSLMTLFELFSDGGDVELVEETFLEALECLKFLVRAVE